MAPISRFKCYFGCVNDGPLHRFPNPIFPHLEKFEKWKNVLDKSIQEKGDTYIYNQVKFCNKHFEQLYISRSNRLTANAVPTLMVIGSSQQAMGSQNLEIAVPSTSDQNCAQVETTESSFYSLTSHNKNYTQGTFRRNNATDAIITKLKNKIASLTMKCKTEKKKLLLTRKLCKTKSFMRIVDRMPDAIRRFTLLQMKWKTKPRGRRFSLEEKIMALTIYKQSQKGYNLLRKLFVLPSKHSLQNMLSTLRIKPGINFQIMENLKQTVLKLPTEKRLCTLLFDEVALSPGLHFFVNEIIGFEDDGDKKKPKIADHALVFMIKGIKTKSNQPVCFTFCQSATKSDDLKVLIKTVIEELSKTGIIVIATICDQASCNVSAIKNLRNDTQIKYCKENKEYKSTAVEIGDIKFFPLFDTPHLLKGVRNNFMVKNIQFTQNGKKKIAKWDHLKMLLDMDTGNDEIRLVNKLTESHIDIKKINKMKVKYAAQIFSQRVSSGMRFLAKHKILPEECEDTADLLLLFDKLFDSFNGHSYHDTTKVLKGCLKNNSQHFQYWNEVLPVLESMLFETKKQCDGIDIIKLEKIPSIKNWITNIKTFMEMWKHLNEMYRIKNIITRNFNQDPLENFFCCIRSNSIRNVNPTCLQFVNAFKTLLINNFDSPHSINANCEKQSVNARGVHRSSGQGMQNTSGQV